MHECPQIRNEICNPEIPELRLTEGGDARAEKLAAHRFMKNRRPVMVTSLHNQEDRRERDKQSLPLQMIIMTTYATIPPSALAPQISCLKDYSQQGIDDSLRPEACQSDQLGIGVFP